MIWFGLGFLFWFFLLKSSKPGCLLSFITNLIYLWGDLSRMPQYFFSSYNTTKHLSPYPEDLSFCKCEVRGVGNISLPPVAS